METNCCLDCLNFRYKNDEAYCRKGMLGSHNGNELTFKDIVSSRRTSYQYYLINRGREMKKLHPKNCIFFDYMGKWRTMRKIKINTPIWSSRSVGIADYKLDKDDLEIEIMYRNGQQKRVYPYPFSISCEKAKTYPIQNLRGLKLRIIPIKDLTELHYTLL